MLHSGRDNGRQHGRASMHEPHQMRRQYIQRMPRMFRRRCNRLTSHWREGCRGGHNRRCYKNVRCCLRHSSFFSCWQAASDRAYGVVCAPLSSLGFACRIAAGSSGYRNILRAYSNSFPGIGDDGIRPPTWPWCMFDNHNPLDNATQMWRCVGTHELDSLFFESSCLCCCRSVYFRMAQTIECSGSAMPIRQGCCESFVDP